MAENDQLALHFTEAMARYIQAKFHQQLEGSDEHVSLTSDWDLTVLQECDQAIGILWRPTTTLVCTITMSCICGLSQMNPFSDTTNWRAEDYVKDLRSSNGKVEAQNILQPFHLSVTT